MDRRKKSRENREQLRCCNWIQLPTGPIPEIFLGVKAGRRQSQEPEYLSDSPHSCSRPAVSGRIKHGDTVPWLQRKNFFAKRRMRAGRCDAANGGLTSPTLGVGGNLYAKSPNMSYFRGARAFCPSPPAFCRRQFADLPSKLLETLAAAAITARAEAVRQHAGQSGQHARAPQHVTCFCCRVDLLGAGRRKISIHGSATNDGSLTDSFTQRDGGRTDHRFCNAF